MSEQAQEAQVIDWSSDEAVVRAVYAEAQAVEMEDNSWRIYDSRSIFRGVPLNIGATSPTEAWAAARRHPNVEAFERAHRPEQPQEACEYCPICYAGAAHNARVEDGVNFGTLPGQLSAAAPQPQEASAQPNGTPLTVAVKDGVLTVTIGIGTLAECAHEGHRRAWKGWVVSDPQAFAKDVSGMLQQENDIGSSLIGRTLNKACRMALEDGSAGVEKGEHHDRW